MNRVRDDSGFAVCFVGLGYIALWPFTSSDQGGTSFAAAVFCRAGTFSLPDLLCNLAHPVTLPPAMHVIGLAAAVFVALRLLLRAIRRRRRAPASGAGARSALAARIPAANLRVPPRKPARWLRPVKPRSHFGLRGMPR